MQQEVGPVPVEPEIQREGEVVLRGPWGLGVKWRLFCSVAPGSGLTDLADRSHCKAKRELMIQRPHLWSDMQHTEMVWTWAPPSLTGCSSLNGEGKVTVPRNRERSPQDFRARKTLLEPMQPHLSLHNGHLPEVFYRQRLTTII